MTHISRHFDGPGLIEAGCPCPKAGCGMVDTENTSPDCLQHPPTRCKTIRSGHRADECPDNWRGPAYDATVVAEDKAREAVIRESSAEEAGYFSPALLDALDDYRDAVARRCAEEIRAWSVATYPAPRQQAPLRHVADTAAGLIDAQETP
ncbi:hypothetical protein ADL27_38480 [Streptomyces sp. NRRL F-6602]|nr:hypothetical protein ADL27_38480 [Streptomyces sp. NRRL F-6602]